MSKPRLTPVQAQEIRERFAAGGITKAQLAREYGVSKSVVGRCVDPALAEAHRNANREYMRKVLEADPDRDRRYREQNPETFRETQRRYREANRDVVLERTRKWREANAEHRRAYYEANREKILARGAVWRDENRERLNELSREWQRNNPDRARIHKANRRARELDAYVEDVDRRVVWLRDGGVCGICGEAADRDDWHLDHVQPLARGGLHCYENVQVTHPACNQRKGARAA